MSTNATVSSTTPTGIITTSDGKPTWNMTKWMQSIGSTINANFDPNGDYQGPIGSRATINGRATLASIVQFLDTGGVVTGPGVDFARAYLNKDTDHIADGFGSPLAGGKAAYTALVASPPAVTPHKWLAGLVSGVFVESQPEFADLSGAATVAQVPPLSSLSGRITAAQLPVAGISVTIVTAQLTTLGTQGSMTFVGGQLVGQVAAT